MPTFKLPYDHGTIEATIPEKSFAGLIQSGAEDYHNPLTEAQTVEKSLDNPIGSPTLEELARGKKDIVLISSDHTRPVPSHIITPCVVSAPSPPTPACASSWPPASTAPPPGRSW